MSHPCPTCVMLARGRLDVALQAIRVMEIGRSRRVSS